MLARLASMCQLDSVGCCTTKELADFLCLLADSSDRPASQLKSAMAAVSCLFSALDKPSPSHDPVVLSLVRALNKTSTTKPAKRTAIMPLQPFNDLFLSWPDNDSLDLEKLRLKSITLTAIAFMARPSDLAPRGVSFDPVTFCVTKQVLSVHNIHFNDDGSMTVHFFATKNDSTRSGFEVRVPGASHPKSDPVRCLQTYISRTESVRPCDTAPLFIGLRQPHDAISSATIAKVLDRAIELAGLDRSKYSARNFRPSAATAAVDAKVPTETAMQLGRWKTREVFLNHYVYPHAPDDYTDNVVGGHFQT